MLLILIFFIYILLSGVQCPDPVSPTSGYIEVSNFNGKYEFGAVASYRCNSGHILWGNSSRYQILFFSRFYKVYLLSICGRDGSWQGSPPRCHLITCGNPPLVENAVVELLNGSTSWQSIIIYQCSAGYYDIMQGRHSSPSMLTQHRITHPFQISFPSLSRNAKRMETGVL